MLPVSYYCVAQWRCDRVDYYRVRVGHRYGVYVGLRTRRSRQGGRTRRRPDDKHGGGGS